MFITLFCHAGQLLSGPGCVTGGFCSFNAHQPQSFHATLLCKIICTNPYLCQLGLLESFGAGELVLASDGGQSGMVTAAGRQLVPVFEITGVMS